MKDALGHGSESRGGGTTESRFHGSIEHQIARGQYNPAPPAAHSQGVQDVGVPMQRRQYEAIAGAINSFPHQEVRADLASHFAGALRGTNPLFNADKFRTAATTGKMGRTKNAAPGMTHAHYNLVADTVKGFGASHPGIKDELTQHFAGRLGASNANFKPGRFSKRAGG